MGTKSLPEWHAMGAQCIVVRETPSSNPGGEPPFLDPSLSEDIV